MNEMKPEDVMRALECCVNGSCADCPNDEIGTYSQCITLVMKNALALLREKDALIAKHEAYIDNLNDDKAYLVEQLNEKEAKIERLQEIADAVADTIPVCEGCDGKTEFGERTEQCLYGIDDTYCARRATEKWFAIRVENDELKAELERYRETVGDLIVRDGEVVGRTLGKDVKYIEKGVADVFKQMAKRQAREEAVDKVIALAKKRLPIVSPSVFDGIGKEAKEKL